MFNTIRLYHLVNLSLSGLSLVIQTQVFKEIRKSRQTLTCRVAKLTSFIHSENKANILSSPAWAVKMDENTDKGGEARLIVYALFINKQVGAIETKYHTILGVLEVLMLTIYMVFLMNMLRRNANQNVSFTSDGASVMRSGKGGVAGRLRETITLLY